MKIWSFQGSITDHLLRFPQITHIQRKYLWDIVLPDLWGLVVTGIGIGRMCQSVQCGQFNIDQIAERFLGPKKEFYPQAINIAPATMEFVCPIPDVVTMYFQKWKSLILDNNFYGMPSQYKKNIYILLSDRSALPVNLITLKGAFPITFPAFDMDYKADDILRFQIQFRYDDMLLGVNSVKSIIEDAGKAVTEGLGTAGNLKTGTLGALKNTGSALSKVKQFATSLL